MRRWRGSTTRVVSSTKRTYGTLAGEFVAFTDTRGGLGCCDAAMIGAFVATLTGYQFKEDPRIMRSDRPLTSPSPGLARQRCA
jgi:hypothetical protein